MEHRLHARESVDFRVRLVKEGHVVNAKAINLSPDGLGIERPDEDLRNGQIVDVNFINGKPGYPQGLSHSVRSMIVHTGPNIVGLMFAYDPRVEKALAKHSDKSERLDN